MKKLTLALAAATAIVSAPALAADLGRMPMKAPAAYAPPPLMWNGFYIGANVGWGWGDNNVLSAPAADAASQAFWGPSFAAGASPSTFPLGKDGFFGGGQIGYNMQAGMFVFGIETDFQGADIRDSVTINTAVAPFAPGTFTATQSLDWFGTLRGRLGIATGPALFYVTGGLAYGGVNYAYTGGFPGLGQTAALDTSRTEVGYALGGGIEFAMSQNWSVKAEYLYIDLGDRNLQAIGTGGAAGTAISNRFTNEYHTARIGLNYRFGGGPIMASY